MTARVALDIFTHVYSMCFCACVRTCCQAGDASQLPGGGLNIHLSYSLGIRTVIVLAVYQIKSAGLQSTQSRQRHSHNDIFCQLIIRRTRVGCSRVLMLIIHPKSLSSVSCFECHGGEHTHTPSTYSALIYFCAVCVATQLTLWPSFYIIVLLQIDYF